MKKLEKLREEIRKIDEEILSYLNERSKYSLNEELYSDSKKCFYVPLLSVICKKGIDPSQEREIKKLDNEILPRYIQKE